MNDLGTRSSGEYWCQRSVNTQDGMSDVFDLLIDTVSILRECASVMFGVTIGVSEMPEVSYLVSVYTEC